MNSLLQWAPLTKTFAQVLCLLHVFSMQAISEFYCFYYPCKYVPNPSADEAIIVPVAEFKNVYIMHVLKKPLS